jgi:hypothetical protein
MYHTVSHLTAANMHLITSLGDLSPAEWDLILEEWSSDLVLEFIQTQSVSIIHTIIHTLTH